MKIALSVTNQQRVGTDQVIALHEQLEMVRRARDAGWHGIFAGQHYLSDEFTNIQPIPYLARIAAESGDMNLITFFLLPLHNPVAVAENFASLDVVAGGCLIFGVGLGYRDIEFEALGVPRKERVARLEANLDIVLRLWQGEKVDSDLPWCQLDSAQLALLPVQRPRPPVWMAANGDQAVKRAARLSDAWLINAHASIETVQRQVSLYRSARNEAGLEVGSGLPVMREVFCARDRETAIRKAMPFLRRKYQVYADWGQDKALPERVAFDGEFEELSSGRFIIGSPEDCIRQLLPWRDSVGVSQFVFRTRWPGMPLQDALESIDLLAREVVPVLQGQ